MPQVQFTRSILEQKEKGNWVGRDTLFWVHKPISTKLCFVRATHVRRGLSRHEDSCWFLTIAGSESGCYFLAKLCAHTAHQYHTRQVKTTMTMSLDSCLQTKPSRSRSLSREYICFKPLTIVKYLKGICSLSSYIILSMLWPWRHASWGQGHRKCKYSVTQKSYEYQVWKIKTVFADEISARTVIFPQHFR